MTKKIRHISDTVLALNEDISDRSGKGKQFDMDILPTMNNLLWGLKSKKLIVIAGRPSMGKSSLMMNMAWCFAQKHKVMFCNLETTIEEFSERLLSYTQRIDNFDLLSGRCIKDTEYVTKFNKFKEVAITSKLIISESYGSTFDDLIEVIEKTGDDYGVIFIDYLQKIKMTGRTERETMDRYLNQLSDLAIEKDVCIVLGSQINRATHEGKNTAPPMMHEIKGTGGIEEKAHQVWLLHWSWWYDKEKKKEEYQIRIAKNKDGRIGRMDVCYQPEYYRIYEGVGYDDRNGHTGYVNKGNSTDYFHD